MRENCTQVLFGQFTKNNASAKMDLAAPGPRLMDSPAAVFVKFTVLTAANLNGLTEFSAARAPPPAQTLKLNITSDAEGHSTLLFGDQQTAATSIDTAELPISPSGRPETIQASATPIESRQAFQPRAATPLCIQQLNQIAHDRGATAE